MIFFGPKKVAKAPERFDSLMFDRDVLLWGDYKDQKKPIANGIAGPIYHVVMIKRTMHRLGKIIDSAFFNAVLLDPATFASAVRQNYYGYIGRHCGSETEKMYHHIYDEELKIG